MRLFFDVAIVFCGFTGFCIAWYVRHKKQAMEKMVCYLGSKCEDVVHSEYSKFFGMPVEVLGMLYYLAIALGHGTILAFSEVIPSWFVLAFLTLSTFAFLFSLYLTFIQGVLLREWCMWCLFSAGLCTLIFIASIVGIAGDFIGHLAESKWLIVMLHSFVMAIGVGAVTLTDIFFFKFLKNFKITRSEADTLRTLSQVIWAALGVLIITGVALYLPQATVLNASSKFLAKVVIVAVILINGSFLNLYASPHLVKISFGAAHHHTPGELHELRKTSFALGAISLTSWYCAFILGSVRSIPLSAQAILTIYIGLLLVAIVASQIVERSFSRRAFE